MNVILQVKKIQCFSDNEVLSLISPDILQAINSKDEHPFFQTYCIAHEGLSKPKVLGLGGKIINWTKAAIQSIKNVIKMGIKCFKGHNKDNSTNDRKEYGKIVGYTEKEIDNKLHAIAVIYHPKEVANEAKDFDICSQEAEWELLEDQDGKLIANVCNELTGIAFDNSNNNQPAFQNAKRLAMVQCFEEQDIDNKQKEVKPMTFEEIKKAKAELNVHPSQLYSFEDLKKDREFAKMFEKYEADIKTKENEALKFKADFEETNKKLLALEGINLKATVKSRLEKIIKEKNETLTEKEKTFIFDTLERAKDITDKGLEEYLSSRKEDYKIFMKLNGKEIDIPNANEQTKNETKNYNDPKDNDII